MCSRIVRQLRSYYGSVRLLTIVHYRLRLLTFPIRTRAAQITRLLVDREISRFPYKELLHMPGSPTTPGRAGTRVDAPVRVAFRQENGVSTRKEATFAARWLAYAYPCQRFADPLTGACA